MAETVWKAGMELSIRGKTDRMLNEPGENIELKIWNVVVAREVDGCFKRHRFQSWWYRMNLR
jgi:hypothetical protein